MSLPPLVYEAFSDDEALAAASERLRDHCGWHIAPVVTETITLDGPGGTLLLLPSLRVVDVHSVTNDGVAVTDFEWSAKGWIRGSWTSRARGIVVNLTHGFDDCPAAIRSIASRMARDGLGSRARRESAGVESVDWSPAAVGGVIDIPADAFTALAPYELGPRA